MNADPAAQLRLLDLQAADTELAQLAHRRSSLPELATLVDVGRRADELAIDAADLQMRLEDVVAEQRRLENDVDTVRARAHRDDQRLTQGGLPAKELEGLQHEIVTLARRQSALEDDVLEVMEQRETIESDVSAVAGRQSAVDAERSKAASARDGAFSEIDAQAQLRGVDRERIAATLPTDLLQLYDRIRAVNGGIGAALLRQRRCDGCRIELAGNELATARAAAPDAIVRCDNCRRILVRTADSGL